MPAQMPPMRVPRWWLGALLRRLSSAVRGVGLELALLAWLLHYWFYQRDKARLYFPRAGSAAALLPQRVQQDSDDRAADGDNHTNNMKSNKTNPNKKKRKRRRSLSSSHPTLLIPKRQQRGVNGSGGAGLGQEEEVAAFGNGVRRKSMKAALSLLNAEAKASSIGLPSGFASVMLSSMKHIHKHYWPMIINSGWVHSAFSLLPLDKLPLPFGLNPYKRPKFVRVPLIMPDGGRVIVSHAQGKDLQPDSPVVLVFPGNLGDTDAPYMTTMLCAIARKGWRSVIYVRRGCGENLLVNCRPQNYADDDDIKHVLRHVLSWYPDSPLFAVGFSLGGNVLARHLGKCGQAGQTSPILAAATLGNPWNLVGLSYWLKYHGRTSDWSLRTTLCGMIERNSKIIDEAGFDAQALLKCTTYRQIVNRFHHIVWGQPSGYKHLDEYMHASSSAHVVQYTQVPLLCINADDDPIVPPGLIPYEAFDHNPNLVLAKMKHGGHHAFIGMNPWASKWSDRVIVEWIDAFLNKVEPQPVDAQELQWLNERPDHSPATGSGRTAWSRRQRLRQQRPGSVRNTLKHIKSLPSLRVLVSKEEEDDDIDSDELETEPEDNDDDDDDSSVDAARDSPPPVRDDGYHSGGGSASSGGDFDDFEDDEEFDEEDDRFLDEPIYARSAAASPQNSPRLRRALFSIV
eukprot:TRINITY_DN93565_c0_g1_i1.p1 TRINITY_DN93565_c0_g1~~TRINITY_DN93565_c0_g1_i1.p1  ORF type:complete len:711 (+),score=315.53 TRINITY_DN93565_c0_g1_i1:89-2134(+)